MLSEDGRSQIIRYFARESNHWRDFFPFIPALLTPHDHEAIRQFFQGDASLYHWAVIRDWAVPVAVCPHTPAVEETV